MKLMAVIGLAMSLCGIASGQQGDLKFGNIVKFDAIAKCSSYQPSSSPPEVSGCVLAKGRTLDDLMNYMLREEWNKEDQQANFREEMVARFNVLMKKLETIKIQERRRPIRAARARSKAHHQPKEQE